MAEQLLPVENNGVVPTDSAEVVQTTGAAMVDLDALRRLAQTAEERVQAMNQIVRASVTACGQRDWVDLGGKPYPMEYGCERMARLWGVHMRIVDGPTREDREDGFLYRTKLRAWSDILGRSTEVVGMRSSKDPFFSVRYRDGSKVILEPQEVNERDIAAASQTNAKVRAITELLGIRGLEWADLARYGITRDQSAGTVTYGEGSTGGQQGKGKAKGQAQGRTQSAAEQDADQDQKRAQIRDWLLEMYGGDKAEAQAALKELTAFTGKDGTKKHATSPTQLKGKWLQITHGKLADLYAEFEAKRTEADPVGAAEELALDGGPEETPDEEDA